MSKRKLTDQQSRRVQLIQEARAEWGEVEEGLLISQFGKSADVEGQNGEIFRCTLRQHLGSLVAGDRVIWQPGPAQTGVIVAVEERKTVLGRVDRHEELKPVAANVDQMIIVVSKEPELQTYLIDSYLVAANLFGLQAVICLNKSDLLNPQDPSFKRATWYETIGIPVIQTSVVQAHGLTALLKVLREKISVFVGQSGVGKSSLISAILPEETIRVGAISEQTLQGRHTTTNSRLYHLPAGGDLIDSPGIRDFRLEKLSPSELAKGFIEFQPFIDHCKFRDCSHDHEPGCAIRNALQEHRISLERYQNFQLLSRELGGILRR